MVYNRVGLKDGMLQTVEFTSLDDFRKRRPSLNVVVISILDHSERRQRKLPNLSGFRSSLSLHFEDTSEETKCAEPGSWPDLPDPFQHARFAQDIGELVPTLKDAKRIASFVQTHHASQESLHALVHCMAGLSRSAAVALWVHRTFGVPFASDRSTARANPRLLRLLAKTPMVEDLYPLEPS